MRFLIAAGRETPTNAGLIEAMCRLGVPGAVCHPARLAGATTRGDVVLGRVDVLPSLDGVEGCLWHLRRLEGRGVRVLNDLSCLLATHDKLHTAIRLARAALPHPRTALFASEDGELDLTPPVVLKPRFGSWGREVELCETPGDLARALHRLRHRSWFRRHGVLVQEYVPSAGRDLRVLVAAGEVVGAIERRAAPGEWRTNVALGGTRHRVALDPGAVELALATARAVRGDLVGVDLLPYGDGWVVLEVNGAVDFTSEYSLAGADVFDAAARALLGRQGESLSVTGLAVAPG
jgi:RimK family alpha-L-glutamate ligase